MAVVHIPEDEAVNDIRAVFAKVDAGDRVVIDRGPNLIELSAAPLRILTVAESSDLLKSRGNTASGEDRFADDIELAMRSMRVLSNRPDPWG